LLRRLRLLALTDEFEAVPAAKGAIDPEGKIADKLAPADRGRLR
jgi:hypothetical protein